MHLETRSTVPSDFRENRYLQSTHPLQWLFDYAQLERSTGASI
jgi:hypothetical protein